MIFGFSTDPFDHSTDPFDKVDTEWSFGRLACLSYFQFECNVIKLLHHLTGYDISEISTVVSRWALTKSSRHFFKFLAFTDTVRKHVDSSESLLFGAGDIFLLPCIIWFIRVFMLDQDVAQFDRHFEIEHLNLKFQCRHGRNHWWVSSRSVCVVWWANKLSLLSFLKLHHTFIPSFDDLTYTNLKFEWLLFFNRGVKN